MTMHSGTCQQTSMSSGRRYKEHKLRCHYWKRKWQVSKGNVALVAMEKISVPNLPADLSFQNHSSTLVPRPLQHHSDCIP